MELNSDWHLLETMKAHSRLSRHYRPTESDFAKMATLITPLPFGNNWENMHSMQFPTHKHPPRVGTIILDDSNNRLSDKGRRRRRGNEVKDRGQFSLTSSVNKSTVLPLERGH